MEIGWANKRLRYPRELHGRARGTFEKYYRFLYRFFRRFSPRFDRQSIDSKEWRGPRRMINA